jgi:hypothetical protein
MSCRPKILSRDWQLEVWQRCIDTLPPRMLMYGTDTFWPVEPAQYRESYLQPQLGLFETATTLGHIVQEGSPARADNRNMIFFQNAFDHWQNAVREPQNPRPAAEPIEVPNAHRGRVRCRGRLFPPVNERWSRRGTGERRGDSDSPGHR